MQSLNYYTYKKSEIRCQHCAWTGFGEKTIQGEMFRELFEIECPKCKTPIAMISFPSYKEVMKHGTEADKEAVMKSMSFEKRVKTSRVNSLKKIMDIEGEIVVEIKENPDEEEEMLGVYANNHLLWKEVLCYEYGYRFIEIIELLNKKYKGRIKAIKYEKSMYLLGDDISLPAEIKNAVSNILAQTKKL